MLVLGCCAVAYAGSPGDPAIHGLADGDADDGIPERSLRLEEGVVLIEVPGIAEQDIVAWYDRDTLFLPYLYICDFLNIPATISADQMMLEGSLPAGQSFEISRVLGLARQGAREIPFNPADIMLVKGELFIRHSLFFSVLGVNASFYLRRLTLTIPADDRIPLVRWRRSMRQAGVLASQESDRYGVVYGEGPRRQFLGAPILDWTLTHSLYSGLGSAGGAFTIGGAFLFGQLEVGLSGGMKSTIDRRVDMNLDRWNWRYLAPSSTVLRQLELGSMSVAGTRVHGIELSNVPLATRSFVGEHDLQGQTQPGWLVEMYDGSRLVDAVLADSLGYYEFHVPVGYGIVDRVLRFVGPHGESFVEARRVQLSTGILPAGEVQYTVRAGAERYDLDAPMGVEGRVGVGVAKRLTLAAEGVMPPAERAAWSADSLAPAVSAIAWLGSSSSLALRYGMREQLLKADFYTIFPNNLTVRAGVDSLTLDAVSMRGLVDISWPVRGVSFGAQGTARRRDGIDGVELTPRFSGYVSGLNFIASTSLFWGEDTAAAAPGGFPLREIRSRGSILATFLPGMVVKGEGEYDHMRRRVSLLDLNAYIRLTDMLALGVGYGVPDLDWRRGMLRAQVELQFSPARIFLNASRESDMIHTSMTARGSAAFSGSGVATSPEFTVGKAAILLKAFRDLNGNGIRDVGEEELPPPSAVLSLGRMQFRSSDGAFSSLTPNMEWNLEVDNWEYAAEGIFPARTRHRLFLLPSTVTVIDVPYSEGIDVMGRVIVEERLPDGGSRELPVSLANGLRVALVSESRGALYEGDVFPDGTLLVPGVAAGAYTLRFDPAQLDSRRLAAGPGSGEIVLDGTDDRLPAVHLIRMP